MADRADAETDQVTVGMRGVAHEIPVQVATLLRPRKLVARQGEMIHADVDITGGSQSLDRALQQRKLDLAVGQVALRDALLGLEQLWQVRVAVHRDPIRARLHHDVQRALEPFACLFRQAIDQVDVDRAHAMVAAGRHDGHRFLDALHAVDGLLHLGIEVLHAEACAIEAHACEFADVLWADEARVELDGEVHATRRRKTELAAQFRHAVGDLRR